MMVFSCPKADGISIAQHGAREATKMDGAENQPGLPMVR
jgi:hypothetical protein